MIYIMIYIMWEVFRMETAKLFENGRSQAVRLPKKFRFSGEEVYIQKMGEMVILLPKERVWDVFMEGLQGFSDDFFENGREKDEPQNRENL